MIVCPNCQEQWDAGFAFCPECNTPLAAAGAAGRSNQDRWEQTIIDREAPNFRAQRASFRQGRGQGDWYQDLSAGAQRDNRLRFGDATEAEFGFARTGGGSVDDDEADHTKFDRGDATGFDDSDESGDSDKTQFTRGPQARDSGPLAYLIQRNGIRAGSVYRLNENTAIGRAQHDNHVALDDSSVSRRHARVWREDGSFRLWDLASANGSFVITPEGKRRRILAPHDLADGDTVDLGDVRLTFLLVLDVASGTDDEE